MYMPEWRGRRRIVDVFLPGDEELYRPVIERQKLVMTRLAERNRDREFWIALSKIHEPLRKQRRLRRFSYEQDDD